VAIRRGVVEISVKLGFSGEALERQHKHQEQKQEQEQGQGQERDIVCKWIPSLCARLGCRCRSPRGRRP
jgi:hypothetical protein